jgi:hypothetical protein
VSANDTQEAAALMGMVAVTPSHGWKPVPRDDWRDFDVLLMRVGRYACHVGLVFGSDFLHCLKGRNVALERLTSMLWAGSITGGYRWTGR